MVNTIHINNKYYTNLCVHKMITDKQWEHIFKWRDELAKDIIGYELYECQKRFSNKIIKATILSKGETFVAQWTRQFGKTTILAKVTIPFLLISYFSIVEKFNIPHMDFFNIGFFAPQEQQVKTDFDIVKDTIALLINKGYKMDIGEYSGNTIRINRGKYPPRMVYAFTASPTSHPESKTLNLIILEESQDLIDQQVNKAILPMGASTNANVVWIGVAGYKRCQFQKYKDELDSDHKVIVDYKEAIKEQEVKFAETGSYLYKNYAKYIDKQKREIGEDSDEFKTQYCLSPETKVLTTDLNWVRIDSLKINDELIGFEEKIIKRYHQRKFKESIVEKIGRIKRPCYCLTFEDGTKIISSSEHQWLTFSAGSRTSWVSSEKLKSTDRVYKACNVWEENNKNCDISYLSAAFDGEGCVTQSKNFSVSFSQRNNCMLKKVKHILNKLKFTYNENICDKKSGVVCLTIANGKRELLRFLGMIRPCRLLNNFNPNKIGTLRSCKQKDTNFVHPRLINKEYIGEREVIAIKTSTKTFLAEGLASHNCMEWMLEKGQFITYDDLLMLEEDYEIQESYTDNLEFYAGIDWGKMHDSTILTVIDSNGHILGWHTWRGDNYNNQINDIVYLLRSKYKSVKKVWCDATANQDMAVDSLKAAIDDERRCNTIVIGYKMTSQSKDYMWKNLNRLMRDKRMAGKVIERSLIRFPKNYYKLELKERFIKQFLDLQKDINNGIWKCNHPDGPNFHDDFCDSLALACLAFKSQKKNKYSPYIA